MRLASASADRTIKVWDPRTGNEALSFIGQDRDANAVAWSPDGMVLVSGWSDKKILVYDATAGYVAVRAPQYLPMLDRHLAANPKNQADWRLRAEIHALQEDWDAAAADARKFFALNPEQRWLTLGTWIAGPYPEDLRASQLPENDVNPLNDGPGKKESPSRVRWQPVPLNASGFVNFGALLGGAEHVSAYALVRIYSSEKQQVAALFGSDDHIRLWLNGKLVHERMHQRIALVDEDVIPAKLEAGWNSLLAKVVNVTGEHILYLRLSDTTDNLHRASYTGAQ